MPVRKVQLQAHGRPPVVVDDDEPPVPDDGQCLVAVRSAPLVGVP